MTSNPRSPQLRPHFIRSSSPHPEHRPTSADGVSYDPLPIRCQSVHNRTIEVVSNTKGVRVDLTPYVPRLVIEWLADDPDREGREIEGTMAVGDISGFTAMSEKLAREGKAGAEQVTDVMNATFEALLDVAYS